MILDSLLIVVALLLGASMEQELFYVWSWLVQLHKGGYLFQIIDFLPIQFRNN